MKLNYLKRTLNLFQHYVCNQPLIFINIKNLCEVYNLNSSNKLLVYSCTRV